MIQWFWPDDESAPRARYVLRVDPVAMAQLCIRYDDEIVSRSEAAMREAGEIIEKARAA